ncbi:MAG TPA: hypothetical protein VFO36_12530, partial [Nitrospiraceae bacterium]|nr:hypothetical protein [Nitrospiraceae bacterium]
FIEKLSMDPAHVRLDRLNTGAPLLDTHDSRTSVRKVVGVVEKAWIVNGEGRAIVRFSKREDVDSIWADVVDGIVRNVSVGYLVHKFQDVTEKNTQTETKIRTFLATDWEPNELSLVPVGADAKAGVRSDSPEVMTEISEQSEIREQVDETSATAPAAIADGAAEVLRLLCDLEARA